MLSRSVDAFAGLGDGIVELILSNFAVGHEQVELGQAFFLDVFRRLKKAMPSALAISATDSSSFRVKRLSAFLVQQLQHAHKIFIVGDDRIGQDLLGLESRALVVGSIME